MLMTPFLPKWTYTRQHEQIAGGQKYRPPSVDVNAPDLFIPLMAAWGYALLCCVVAALGGKFKPDLLSSSVRRPVTRLQPHQSSERPGYIHAFRPCCCSNPSRLTAMLVAAQQAMQAVCGSCVWCLHCLGCHGTVLAGNPPDQLTAQPAAPSHARPPFLPSWPCAGLCGQIYSACLAWFVHWLAARVLLKGMNVPGVPWSELAAYTGYSFVQVCLSIVVGCIAGEGRAGG
jgi:hypothetical protein